MEEIIEWWTQAHQGHARRKGSSAEQPLSPSMWEEFKFIAHVTQYVKFIYQYSKTSTKPGHFSLPDNIPLLGPHFIPPMPHIVSRHCKIPLVLEAYYLCPVTIVHPIYYPIRCPDCRKASETPDTLSDSTNNQKISPERWTSDGPRCVHGVDEEEFALGLQMKCKICKANRSLTKGSTKTNIVFSLTSIGYWEGIPYWEIPGALPTC